MSAFWGVLYRDLLVFRKRIRGNLVRVALQPLFFLIVFGYIMPKIGLFQRGYGSLILPGLVTMSLMSSAMFGVAMTVGLGLYRNKGIRAELQSPITMFEMSVEKVLFGVIQGMFSAVIILIIGMLMLENIAITPLFFAGFLMLAALTSAIFGCIGLLFGSLFRIPAAMFEASQLFLMPMMFFGATFFPLFRVEEVSTGLYWLLFIFPNTYTNEALRGLLLGMEGLPIWLCFAVLLAFLVVLFLFAWRALTRRVIA